MSAQLNSLTAKLPVLTNILNLKMQLILNCISYGEKGNMCTAVYSAQNNNKSYVATFLAGSFYLHFSDFTSFGKSHIVVTVLRVVDVSVKHST